MGFWVLIVGWVFYYLLVATTYCCPVYDVPYGGNVVFALVFVFEIVGMFPEVDTEEGYGSLYFFIHEGVILVLGGDDGLAIAKA